MFATSQSSRSWMWLMLSSTNGTFSEGCPAAVGQHLQTRLRNWQKRRLNPFVSVPFQCQDSVALYCGNDSRLIRVDSTELKVTALKDKEGLLHVAFTSAA